MSESTALQQQHTGDGAITSRPSIEGVEQALLDGDLSKLSPQARVDYMTRVCESVGLNPLTKPFRYIRLNGQLTLYATRDAAEQLRKLHGISITRLEESWREDICVVRAYAQDQGGRTDVATGAVDTSRSSGQNLANDIMKAETKAKRRVTLSMAGLGWLDETEVQDIPSDATEAVHVDHQTGRIEGEEAPERVELHAHEVLPSCAEKIEAMDERLSGIDDADALNDALDKAQAYVADWPEPEREAATAMLDPHADRWKALRARQAADAQATTSDTPAEGFEDDSDLPPGLQ